MRIYGKERRKVISLFISSAILLTSVIPFTGITAVAEDTEIYEKTTVTDEVNNGSSLNKKLLYTTSKTYATDETDGSLYPVKDGEGMIVSTSDAAKTEIQGTEKYSVSFDIKISDSVDTSSKIAEFYWFSNETPVNSETGQKENKGRLGYFALYKDHVGLSADGNGGDIKNAEIAQGQWVNLEYVVYPQKSENDINKTAWYINGELMTEGRVKTQKEFWRMSENRILNMIYALGVKSECMNLKNFKLCTIESVDESQTFSAAAYVDEGNNIITDFSEEIPDNLTLNSIKVYDKSGDEISKTISLDENMSKLTIVPTVKSENYTVKFPERFMSKNGLSLKNPTLAADGFEQVKLVNLEGSAFSISSDQKAYAKAKLLNTSDNDSSLTIVLAAYKVGTRGLEMLGCTEKTVSVPKRASIDIMPNGENSIELDVPSDAQAVKAFMFSTAENNKPIKDATELALAQYDKSIPDSDGFVQTGAAELALAVNFGESNKNEKASVYVTDSENNCVYTDQVMTDSNGRAGAYIGLSDDFNTGEYKSVVSIGKEYRELSVSYVNAKKYDDAAGKINSVIANAELTKTEKAESISKLLGDNYSYFGIDDALFSYTDSLETATLLCNELSKDNAESLPLFGDGSFENLESGSGFIKRLYIIEAIGNGKISNLFDYSKELALSDDKNYEWYTKEYVTENVQKDITARQSKDNISTSNYETQEMFYNRLVDSYILAIVKAPNGEDNLKEVLSNFSSYIGINSNLKSSTLTSLKGMNLKTVKGENGLKDTIDGLEKENSGSSTQGGGGSRTGGSGGKSSSMSFDSTVSQEKEPEIIPSDIFNDLSGYDWAKQAITYLAELRIVKGKTDDTFCPSDLITREEFAAMLVRAFAKDAEQAEVDFNDTDKNAWYFEFLGKAKTAGIINGYDDGSFGIGENISRQDMVAMASRAAKYSGIMLNLDGGYNPFDDDAQISDYAKQAVYEMKNAEIVNGVSERTFAPLDNAERAHAAKVIFELLNV